MEELTLKKNRTLVSSEYHLPPQGIEPIRRNELIGDFKNYIETQKEHFLGYQANQDIEFQSETAEFLNYHVNNIGDPFTNGNFTINSKVMEKEVLDYYARLWHAKARKENDLQDPESYWGYVLTMGSSEGNIYGLWNARDYLAGRQLEVDKDSNKLGRTNYLQPKAIVTDTGTNAYTPVAFFSEDAHYSITKFMRVLGIGTFNEIGEKYYKGQNPLDPNGDWSKNKEVPSVDGSAGPGSVDVKKLATLVEFFASKGYPILVICNFGSTFKGAYDDVEDVQNTLMPIFKKYGLVDRKVTYEDNKGNRHEDIRNGYWIHVDGALGSSYMPFVEKAYEEKKISQRGPNFDFRLPGVNSIVMSGHKWPGAPWPCGIFMTKSKYQLFPPDDPAYIGSPDTTFSGSRNGFSAIIMWDFLARNSYDTQIDKVVECEHIVKYAEEQLNKLQKEHYPHLDLYVARTPLALTVRFRRPNDKLVFKYSLSCESLMVATADGKEVQHDYAHVYAMTLVTENLIDEFIKDLQDKDAFPQVKSDKVNAIPRFGHSSGWK
ncbi:MAG TPA: pyridoxal-dependent decarboxylase [Paludibacter sp.]|nr:pyridoxal-dependent decarboxylase [Paludibacter sp.]